MKGRIKRDLKKLSQQYLEEKVDANKIRNDISELYYQYSRFSIGLEVEKDWINKNVIGSSLASELPQDLFQIESEEDQEKRIMQHYKENKNH